MSTSSSESTPAIGFISIVEAGELGFCGGYLLLDTLGRPREFHCTLPNKPTRTQQILYGATLRPHLFCDQIGRALLEKSQLPCRVILTDMLDLLRLEQWSPVPLACLVRQDGSRPVGHGDRSLESTEFAPSLDIAGQRLVTSQSARRHHDAIRMRLAKFAAHLPLGEPFERIHEAIEEAHAAAC